LNHKDSQKRQKQTNLKHYFLDYDFSMQLFREEENLVQSVGQDIIILMMEIYLFAEIY